MLRWVGVWIMKPPQRRWFVSKRERFDQWQTGKNVITYYLPLRRVFMGLFQSISYTSACSGNKSLDSNPIKNFGLRFSTSH
jgi:hypothetical protein